MKIFFILLILLQLQCATKILGGIGGMLGDAIDSNFNSNPIQNKICKFTDEEFHAKTTTYANEFYKPAQTIGLLGDIGIAASFVNQSTLAAAGGFFYVMGGLTFLIDKKKFTNELNPIPENGWYYNDRSPCVNLNDFFVAKIEIERKEVGPCTEFEKAEGTFYEKLLKSVDSEKASVSKLKKIFPKPNFVLTTHEDRKQYGYYCYYQYYVEHKGGILELRRRF